MCLKNIEEMLSEIEMLNHGVNHGCEYALYCLPPADELCKSLDLYFSSLSTSSVSCLPAARWHIRVVKLGPSWQAPFVAQLKSWFFGQEYSPKSDALSQDAFCAQFVNELTLAIGAPEVFEVLVDPPMWYDCQWQDFALVSEKGAWILHLGFSD